MICQMMGQTLNLGSSRLPERGMSSLICPWRSLSRVTASGTGALMASGLSTFSPKVSWSRKTLFWALSFRPSIRYFTSKVSFPLMMG